MTRVEGGPAPPVDDGDLGRALKLGLSLPSADFYATTDLATAKRIGGILWLIGLPTASHSSTSRARNANAEGAKVS